MDQRPGQEAPGDQHGPDHVVLGREHHQVELLDLQIAERTSHVGDDVLGAPDPGPYRPHLAAEPPAQLEGGGEPGGLGGADPAEPAELTERLAGQPPKRATGGAMEIFRDHFDPDPGPAGAEQDGQELDRGEGGGTVTGETFAGSVRERRRAMRHAAKLAQPASGASTESTQAGAV
jgi:hypothetical protein